MPICLRADYENEMSSNALKASSAARLRSVPIIAGTVALAAIVGAAQGSVAASVLCAVLVVLLVPCSLIDLERRIIPNRITGPGSLAAVVLGLALDPGGEPTRLLWAAIAGGFLLITALARPSGMGMGDVKLLAMMGLFLGRPVLVALLVALLGSVVTGVVLAHRHGVRAARKTGLPFGPYLAAGGIVAALAGAQLIQAYLSLRH
jgi:leader peptidase (prepilin peptidase) / N-methyltransferase